LIPTRWTRYAAAEATTSPQTSSPQRPHRLNLKLAIQPGNNLWKLSAGFMVLAVHTR
jgi:hypothetical protein